MTVFDKYSFINVVAKTWKLCQNVFTQWRILSVYAGLMTLVTMLLGRWTFACGNNKNFWCYDYFNNNYLILTAIIFNLLINLCLIMSFINEYYAASFENKPFTLRNTIIINKPKLKNSIFLLVYISAIILPLSLAAYIFIKSPNPDWRIEGVYFTIMFFSIFGSMLVVRFFSVVSFYYDNQKLPPLGKITDITAGHALSTVILFWLICFMCTLVYMNIYRSLYYFTGKWNYFANTAISEYVDSFAKLFFIGIIISLARAEQEIQEKVMSKS